MKSDQELRTRATTYAGKSFTIAPWEDGKRLEVRVDRRPLI
jgi:hypothetical protein